MTEQVEFWADGVNSLKFIISEIRRKNFVDSTDVDWLDYAVCQLGLHNVLGEDFTNLLRKLTVEHGNEFKNASVILRLPRNTIVKGGFMNLIVQRFDEIGIILNPETGEIKAKNNDNNTRNRNAGTQIQ